VQEVEGAVVVEAVDLEDVADLEEFEYSFESAVEPTV